MKKLTLLAALAAAASAQASAPPTYSIVITEVDPAGSGAAYAGDWFELTNTGASAVNITGWKMDDNSNLFSSAVALRLVTSIAAGQSVVFIEGVADGSTDTTLIANFKTAWFGSNVPSGFTIGTYGGTQVGLSGTADAVNIFDSTGVPVTGVSFGTSTLGATFDNRAGTSGLISTLSVAGTNGAATSANGVEVGSPGVIPQPSAAGLLALGAALALVRRRR